MNLKPRIEIVAEKKLLGKRMSMTLKENKTFELWNQFMRERKLIKNNLTSDLFSMQVYDESLNFNEFSFETVFEKWAAIEVADFNEVPNTMETYVLKGGLYAVFNYKGTPENFSSTFHYIFFEWLPASKYKLDNREHFELLGDKYKLNDPDSEEEIWIPIKVKS